MKHATFVKGEVFWCNECDLKKVHSDKPETGKFFFQFGHTWNHETQKSGDDYIQVIFAFCPTCIEKKGIKEEPTDPFFASFGKLGLDVGI